MGEWREVRVTLATTRGHLDLILESFFDRFRGGHVHVDDLGVDDPDFFEAPEGTDSWYDLTGHVPISEESGPVELDLQLDDWIDSGVICDSRGLTLIRKRCKCSITNWVASCGEPRLPCDSIRHW